LADDGDGEIKTQQKWKQKYFIEKIFHCGELLAKNENFIIKLKKNLSINEVIYKLPLLY